MSPNFNIINSDDREMIVKHYLHSHHYHSHWQSPSMDISSIARLETPSGKSQTEHMIVIASNVLPQVNYSSLPRILQELFFEHKQIFVSKQ